MGLRIRVGRIRKGGTVRLGVNGVCPQGLKPEFLPACSGTTEVVPFPKADMRRDRSGIAVAMQNRVAGRSRGFTVIEMMVVISIILILLGVAMPIYNHSITRAKEQNLRKNLQTLNDLIFEYTIDKQKYPKSLEDLKTAGYLTTVPKDITGTEDWVTESADGTIMSLDQTDPDGIIGVHSGSSATATDGTAYSSW